MFQVQLLPKLTPVLLPQLFSKPCQIIHLLPSTRALTPCTEVENFWKEGPESWSQEPYSSAREELWAGCRLSARPQRCTYYPTLS